MKKSRIIIRITLISIVALIAIMPVFLNKEHKTLNTETRKEALGQFIDLSDGVTYYREAGPDSAQIVLLVHGFSVPCYIFDSTFEALLNNGFHVICYDLYGRGYSDRPSLVYNNELFIRQIEDLLQALHIDKAIHIVGLSMGGPIATEFTVKHADKVEKMVLIDPFNEAVEIPILNVPVLGKYLMNYYVAHLPNMQLKAFYHPENHPDFPQQFKVQMQYKGFRHALYSTLINYVSVDKLSDYKNLEQLHKPVLLIWGENDNTLPFEQSKRLRQVLNCEFLPIKNAGHIPNVEYPAMVNADIIDFLKK